MRASLAAAQPRQCALPRPLLLLSPSSRRAAPTSLRRSFRLQAAAGNEDNCVELSCVLAPYGLVESNARSGEKDFGIWSSGLVPSSAAQPVRAMGARARALSLMGRACPSR